MHKFIVFFFLCVVYQQTTAQLTYKTLIVDYDSAWQYKNLKIIPIRPKAPGQNQAGLANLVSLNEALEKGYCTVQERGSSSVENVHWLSLYNNSDKNIFVSSGEVLSGGRQDRMVTRDTVVMAGTKRTDLHVMCVEEERWSKKDKKFTYEKKANNHLRKVLDQSGNQVLLWNEISRQLTSDTIKNKTLSYLALGKDRKFAALMETYMQFFKEKFHRGDTSIVGVVCLSGDKIIGTDIFASRTLLYGQLHALLGGYIEEAVVYGAQPAIRQDKIEKYMDNILKDETTQEKFVKANGKLFKVNNKVIHITTY